VLDNGIESLEIVFIADAIGYVLSVDDDLISVDWYSENNIPDLEFDSDRDIIDAFYKNQYNLLSIDSNFILKSEEKSVNKKI